MNKIIQIDGHIFGILNGVIMIGEKEIPIDTMYKFVKFMNDNEEKLMEYFKIWQGYKK